MPGADLSQYINMVFIKYWIFLPHFFSMATFQERPKTPPTEYGPSLSSPTVEEKNIDHISINVELNENTNNCLVTEDAISVIETEQIDNDSVIKDACYSLPCVIIIYFALIVNAMLMAAVIIILIQLIIVSVRYSGINMSRQGLILLTRSHNFH